MKLCPILLLILCGAASGLRAQILLEHDYDPLGDRVAAVPLHAGERLTQSFTAPPNASTAQSVRVKLRRVGETGRLEYRVGSRPGTAEYGAGEIGPGDVQPYFERFVPLRLSSAPPPSATCYIQVRVPAGGSGNGYYELFGTAGAGAESPINKDYGAATPAYAGGEAFDSAGRPIPETDFAFQLLGAGGPPARVEEPFRFVDEVVGRTRYARVGPGRPAGAGEIALDASWGLRLAGNPGPAARTAAAELRDYAKQALGFGLDGTARHIVAGTVADLAAYRGRVAAPEAFVVEVTPSAITVAGYDDRGVMRGLFHLQDLIDLRGSPVLKTGTVVRTPRYNPRITCAPFFAGVELEPYSDPYSDGLLSKISHSGYNALYVWAKLYELGQSPALPELAPDAPARLARLRALIRRAAAYGIDIYLYVTLDPLPAAFFEKHPDARGVARNYGQFYGDGYLLCTSAKVVQRYIEEATAGIFRSAPGLRGAIMIPGGEGLFNCRNNGPNTCRRCANRPRDEILAELVGLVKRGAQSASPHAEAATWTYTWPENDPSRAKLISLLPKGMVWLQTFEKEGIIERDGVHDPAYDYTISYLGPSENLKLQMPRVERAGLPLWIKTESMISQEFIQTPYIPVYQRWIERYRRIAATPRVTGIFLNWNHYGFMPSRASELVKWFTWDPLPEDDSLLDRIAARDFGEKAAPLFVRAWKQLGDAISYFPLSDNTSRNGPLPKGPAHPFFRDPDYRPLHGQRRQFFNNLNWTMPWDVEITRKYFGLMEQEWSKAVDLLHEAAAATPEAGRTGAEAETGVAEMQLSCMRSVLNLIEFDRLRLELQQTADPGPVRARLVALLRRERENSLRGLRYVERDSRLGFANGGNGITNGGVRAGIFTAAGIRKKVAQVDSLIREWEPAQ